MANFQSPVKALAVPTLGDKPSPEDIRSLRLDDLQKVVSSATLGNKNPMWNDEVELQSMRSLSYLNAIPGIQGTLNDRIAHRFPLQDMNVPRDAVAVYHACIRYCYENPFVAKATRIKSDFTVQNFEHKTHNLDVKEFYDSWAERLNLKSVLRTVFWQYYGIGVVPIWWGGEEGPITFIEVLDPRMCHIEYNYGKPSLYLKIDERMRQAVADPEGKIDPRNRRRFNSMPKYWVQQIKNLDLSNLGSMALIELQEGSFAVVENRYSRINRTIGGADGLPLQPAFHALQRYQLLSAGDFAVAWNLKNMITLISEGDPKAEGKPWVPVTTERLSNLQANFQRPDSSFTVYCDPTTKVEFVFPPVEIFDTEKYIQPEKEIKEVLNIPSFMWTSEESGSFSNAINELKLLRMEVFAAREVVGEQFFKPFYDRIRGRNHGKAKIVLPSYNIASLQDDASWLKQVSGLYGLGGCSVEFLMEQNTLDPVYQIEQMKIEHQLYGNKSKGKPGELVNDTIMSPLFEPSQGDTAPVENKPVPPRATPGGSGGNTAGSGKQPSTGPKTAARSPRTNGTQ